MDGIVKNRGADLHPPRSVGQETPFIFVGITAPHLFFEDVQNR